MGLFLRQDQGRSELQSKVIADLQERMYSSSAIEGDAKLEDSKYMENQHETRPAGVVIAVLVLILIAVATFF